MLKERLQLWDRFQTSAVNMRVRFVDYIETTELKCPGCHIIPS